MLVEEHVGGRAVTFRREPGGAPTLVFIHGAASNYRIHDRLVEALPGFNRVALNLPGRAGTDGPGLDSVGPMADFVASVLRSVVEGPYVLVGYSLGGAVALELAIRGESDLAGLALIATGARLRVNPLLVKLYEAASESSGELPAMPSAAFEPGTDPALVAEAAEHRTLTPLETAGSDWRACNGFDRMDALERIGVPALVVGGSADILAPTKFAEFLADGIPDSELHLLPGATHMMVMERAREIAPLIASFASRL